MWQTTEECSPSDSPGFYRLNLLRETCGNQARVTCVAQTGLKLSYILLIKQALKKVMMPRLAGKGNTMSS